MMSTLPLYAFVFLLLRISRGEECTTVHTGRSYLNETFSNSQVLLSGTVDKITLVSNTQDVVQRLNVRIRRVFKGQGYLKSRSFVEVDVPSRYKFCISVLLVHDTRVFALSVDGRTFTLSSAVLPVNLSVLDSLHSFILKKPHKKRRKAKPSRCESQLCPLGSKCVFSTGKCECRSHCRSTGPPVCGSDRVSYASACHLFVRACLLAKKGILLRMVGEDACRKRSPCEDLRCGPGEDCVVTQKDGVLSAQCLCPTSCPSYGDSVESSPVCSSQGVDYPSLCHLKQHACLTQTNITVRYFGECDPCSGVDCARGTRCKLSSTRRPECRCSEQCSLNFEPVCATNGLTYTNECVMNVAACKEDIQLSVYKKGKCSEVNNPCEEMQCSRGSRCEISANGTATCVCPANCPLALTPVCGSDGVTYDNECEVQRAACLEETHIAVRHQGICGEGLCATFTCKSPLTCVVIDDKPSCACPHCTDELREVCASDGRTYPNECKMRKAACDSGTALFVKYDGICEGCEKKNCQYYSTCINENGKAECKCPSECYRNTSSTQLTPVCGTDGVTYSSECHLRRSACLQTKFIVVAFEGKCDACIHVECGFGQECRGGSCVCSYQCPLSPPNTARVCGEDGVLYASDCHRQLAACEKGSPIPQMPLTHCHSAVAAVDDACRCHSLGSFGPNCDNDGNCRCRAGVGGAKCDHCLPGFWGLHLIAIGAQSCKPCGCSVFGSSRTDCEQSTGRCECSREARGRKCDQCAPDLVMTASGCVRKEEYRTPGSCSSMECHHGAKCVESAGGHPDCECPVHCDMEHLGLVANMSVCGSDGTTYENMCHLQQFACKHQLDLVPSSLGICSDESAEPRERNNRKKEFPPNVNECASTGSCESDGACKAGDEDCNCSINGEKQHGGQCRPDRGSILNLEMDGEQAYNIDHPNLNLHMNISVKLVPHSSNGAILYARGGQNVLVLRMEMRRIVAELNSKTLYSPRTVALGKNLTIGLLWSGNMVSLRVAGSARVLRVGIDDTPVSELWIGRPGKLSLKSLVSELVINGQAIAGKKLTLFSSMRSLYGGVVELNKGEYAQLLDFHQMPQEKLRVGMDVKPASEEGVLFFWRLSDGLNEGQSSSPTFIGLFLREARLHLVWNVGSGGLRSIRSLTALTRGSWNDVQFELSSSEASISVNGSAVSSHFPAAIDPLPITGESVYIGGVPDDSNLPSPLGNLSRAFAGAVKRLTVNETPFRMQKVNSKNDEGTHSTDGVRCCKAFGDKRFGGFVDEDQAAYFNGSTEHAYLSGGITPITSSNATDFSFEFRTDSSTGVLWWQSGWSGSSESDLLIIHLRKGRVNVAVNLGKDQLKSVSTNAFVADGKWHRIAVHRRMQRTTVSIDGKKTTIVSSPGAVLLNTNGLVYIGGRTGHAVQSRFRGNFVGCVRRLIILETAIDLFKDTVSLLSPSSCPSTRF